eukprot:CAMPEP_0185902856 /NCGR_PEP_ID=MMETSP0196C-20130402/2067_1 /TAXON_ID=2932 /ORGANISM="Alexandrium fundyense, Strain CCMP1719" /LENGTH=80 /DNA_ID=CAMNT_0028621781 /DNA_START=1 /DNA_END=240 /DNA_ORIENTATION=-
MAPFQHRELEQDQSKVGAGVSIALQLLRWKDIHGPSDVPGLLLGEHGGSPGLLHLAGAPADCLPWGWVPVRGLLLCGEGG